MSRIFILKAGCWLLLVLGVYSHLHCQYVIEWAKTYGGLGGKNGAQKVKQTSDDGYIMAGRSECNNGDLPGNYGQMDCWVMKLDNAGNIEWSKNYGGSDYDFATDVIEVENGSFIVNARSQSNNGDVNENLGEYDCWLLKLSKNGDIVWQKNLGGPEVDGCSDLLLLDNGDILTTLNTYYTPPGSTPLNLWWLVKMNLDGNEVWMKNYGNPDSTETAVWPLKGNDGNYYVMGSDLKNGNVIWTRKISMDGEALWENKTYKPSDHAISDFQINSDGNAVGVGTTSFENPDFTPYDGDIRVLSIPLQNQGPLPDGVYGGSGDESGHVIQPLSNGNYLIGGISSSIDGDVGANYSEGIVKRFDWWLFIIDQHGKVIWSKNIGGSGGDLLFSMEPTSDGGFILGGSTSSQDHDVVARYDNFELAWIVKLAPVNTTGTCDPPKLYPNPATAGAVTIEVPQGFGAGSKVEVYDVAGRLVLQLPAAALENKLKVEIPNDWLPRTGMYFVKTNCGEQVHVLKFVRL